MKITIYIVSGMLAALLSAPQTLAADIAGGKAKASGCSSCHGLNLKTAVEICSAKLTVGGPWDFTVILS